MNYNFKLLSVPKPFQPGTLTLWSNAYIANNVLKKHLDGTVDSGSRKSLTIDKATRWISQISRDEPDILDIGCGPGLYGNKLCGMVKSYEGIDISPYQIAYAQEHNMSVGNISYQVCDFKCWKPQRRYDTVMLLYAVYSFYSYEERTNLLKKIREVLNPNGKVIIEVFTSNHYNGRIDDSDWQYIKKNGFWSPNEYLELNSFTWYNDNLILIRAGVVENSINTWNSWIQLFDINSIQRELESVGFTKFTYYGSCYGAKFTSTSDVLCVCAE